MDKLRIYSSTDPPPSAEVLECVEDEEVRPPLPPRPSFHNPTDCILHGPEAITRLQKSSRPQLQASATTALSRTDIHIQSYQNGSREAITAQTEPSTPGRYLKGFGSIRRLKGYSGSEADSASIKSYAPTLEASGDVESLLGEVLGASPGTPAWRSSDAAAAEGLDVLEALPDEDDESLSCFNEEFSELDSLSTDAANEGEHQLVILKIRLNFGFQSSFLASGKQRGSISSSSHRRESLSITVMETIILFLGISELCRPLSRSSKVRMISSEDSQPAVHVL